MSNIQLLPSHPIDPFTSSTMDYTYMNTAHPPYQYFGVPQTPSAGQHMDLDQFSAVQQQQQQQQQHQQQPQNQYDSPFVAFHDSFPYDQPAFIHLAAGPPQIPTRTPSQPMANHPSRSPGVSTFDNMPASVVEAALSEDHYLHRSSSEEKDGRAPQNKRKAQNRAAQRAFRERKERHLKELETKLNNLQQQSMTLDSENERLRKELARMATENEILRATSHAQPSLGEDEESFPPLGYTPPDIETNKETAARRAQMIGNIHTIIIDDNSGELLLNSGRTWDYIQAHESFQAGLVDVGDVIDRLKRLARCDGQGPVFRESDIRKAISESAVAGGRDELL